MGCYGEHYGANYDVCAVVVTGSSAVGRSAAYRQLLQIPEPQQRLHSKVFIIFRLIDVTRLIKKAKIGLKFAIKETLHTSRQFNFVVVEDRGSISRLPLTGSVRVVKNQITDLKFSVSQHNVKQVPLSLGIAIKETSRAKLNFKVTDLKTRARLYRMLADKLPNLPINETELTDDEALGITLIFEDDDDRHASHGT